MARGKKKEAALSPAERLQAALVPESEQPYQVPENWCWVKLGKLSTSQYGYTAKAIKNDTCPKMLRITDIQDNSVDWDNVPNCQIDKENFEKYALSDGDIVIARTGATTGKSFLLNNPYNSVFASYLIRLRISKKISRLYAFEFLQTDCYWKQISELSSGIAQPGVNATKLQSLYFPLAPLAEQQRIVDRIETLFAKLDEAKQKAQDALDSFETCKAAILHKAFTGELTAQWRKEHGVGMESWKKTALKDVCDKIVCGKTPTDFIQPTGEIPYLKVYNIVDNKIDFESMPQFIPKEIHEGKLKSSILKPCDVIMNIVGPPLRKIAIIPDNYPEWNMNQAIVRFRPYDSLQYRFLYYALVNPETLDDVIAATKGVVGQANISVTQSRELVIPLPSTEEQTEIVRILDDLLAKEQQAKEAAEKVLEQIDLTRKAILARAFRGELGTNDPTEESAVELLKKSFERGE